MNEYRPSLDLAVATYGLFGGLGYWAAGEIGCFVALAVAFFARGSSRLPLYRVKMGKPEDIPTYHNEPMPLLQGLSHTIGASIGLVLIVAVVLGLASSLGPGSCSSSDVEREYRAP